MNPVGSELRGRDQGEGAFAQPGMRENKARAAADSMLGHEEIQIEGARPPPRFPTSAPSRLRFEPLTQVQKADQRNTNIQEDRRIEVVRLHRADGFRSVHVGAPQNRDAIRPSEPPNGPPKGTVDLTDVTAQSDERLHDPDCMRAPPRHPPPPSGASSALLHRRRLVKGRGKQGADILTGQPSLAGQGPSDLVHGEPVPLEQLDGMLEGLLEQWHDALAPADDAEGEAHRLVKVVIGFPQGSLASYNGFSGDAGHEAQDPRLVADRRDVVVHTPSRLVLKPEAAHTPGEVLIAEHVDRRHNLSAQVRHHRVAGLVVGRQADGSELEWSHHRFYHTAPRH